MRTPSKNLAVERAQPWLGTLVSMRAEGLPVAEAHRAIDAAFDQVAIVHRLMSFHEASSDVSRLNVRAHRLPLAVHPWTHDVLRWALRFSLLSDGCFDISVGGELVDWQRWALYIIGAGVWLSGGLWLLFQHFFVEQGEFGPKIHPLEPWWLKLHGAFGFAVIWIFGLLWSVHVSRAWPGVRRRWSGGVMTGVFSWLILSGYLLYYAGNENARSVVSVLHWGVGLASPICLGCHRLRFQERGVSQLDRVPDRFKKRFLVAHTLRAGEERQ